MILWVDDLTGKTYAKFQYGDKMAQYECIFTACENPLCRCGTTYLELAPVRSGESIDDHPVHRKVKIDIFEKKPGYGKREAVPEDELEFAGWFINQLKEDDFNILIEEHYAFKLKISEQAPPDSLDVHFDYDEIEMLGSMMAYNDVLPYGKHFSITIMGKPYLILDYHCLRSGCSCTDAMLAFFDLEKTPEPSQCLCSVMLNYRKKKWKFEEGNLITRTLKDLKTAVIDQIPDLLEQLSLRHIKLKSIHKHCKDRQDSAMGQTGLPFGSRKPDVPKLPKVGRNAPCPCGSGKKYKKCCMLTSS